MIPVSRPRAAISRSCRTTTARRPTGSSTASGPSRATTPGIPTSREVGLYDQPFVDTFIHTLSNGGRIIAGQFDDPYQLDEKGIFDLVNLAQDDLGGIPGARRRRPTGRVHGLQRLLDRARGSDRATSSRTAFRTTARSSRLHRQPAPRLVDASAAGRTQTVDPSNIITGLKGSGPWVQVGRNALPLFNAGLVGTQRQTLYLRTSPHAAT